jgi:glycosidase
MIYYGDELGMNGAGDPDNRHMMQWSGYTANQTWLRDRVAALGAIRAAHPALRRGERTTLGATGEVLVYKMTTAGDTVFIALNRSDVAQTTTSLPAGDYTELLSGVAVTAPAPIPPRSALILIQ